MNPNQENSNKNKLIVKKISNYLSLFSALALTTSSIAYYKYQHWPLVIFFITFFIDLIIEKRWSVQYNKKITYLFVAYLLYFLLIPIYHIFEKTNTYYWKAFETYLPFFIFGVIGLFSGYNQKFKIKYFCYVLITVSVISIIMIINRVGILQFFTGSLTFKTESFSLSRIFFFNSHMNYNVYLNLGLLSTVYLLFGNHQKKKSKIRASLLIISGLIIFCTLLISDGRTGFITAIVNLFVAVLFKVSEYKRKLLVPLLVLSIPIIGFGLLAHKRMSQNNLKAEPRFLIWNQAVKTIKNHYILGLGVSDGKNDFLKNGQQDKEICKLPIFNSDFATGKTHPHNQYLWSMISFGIIGLLLFLFVSFYPCFIIEKKNFLYIFMFCFIFGFQSVFETYGVGVPIILFTFLSSIIFSKQRKTISNYQ